MKSLGPHTKATLMDLTTLIASRSKAVEISGIRKVFELARSLKNPVNLSIGQPHFPVPQPIKDACKAAIDADKNAYTVTQGTSELLERLQRDVKRALPGQDRAMMITSGTSGALMLAILATINPGDEVVAADPYFVMYPNMVTLAGGTFVGVDTYPSFAIDPQRFMNACTPRTKMMLLCTPGNPTGAVIDREAQQTLAEFCAKRGILLVSDEIYKAFHYDTPPSCPAEFNPDVLVVEGFGKTYGMTGWRLGYVHGPKVIIDEMMKLQQSTFICAPSMAQWGALAACDFDITGIIADYKQKRDRLVAGLRGAFEFETPGGAFYLFAKAPWGTGTDFVKAGIEKNLLVIPGATFSTKDTHFRISYAATDATIDAGIAILRELAAR